MESLLPAMIEFLHHEIEALSREGGWVFWGLVALAFGIAFALLSLWRALRLPEAPLLASRDWRKLLAGQQPPKALVARLRESLADRDLAGTLEEIDHQLFAVPSRRFPFAFVLIGAAPLIGLLGTVTGMFTTFDGMAGVAASGPVDVISRGVSEALITTQTGLVIGVPSFIACSLLRDRFDRLRLAYRHVVALLMQKEN